ncbi:hypothetical protein [Paraclostridium sordellii]|nr:hypothetical protein [Paeniclostridium sordellii]MDU2688154.1 hypothetical protein [Paeniclostridium sordellii]CEO15737.1 Uncharacterised protein [[Clostridium] sordellii] [Paeniclostridium sordellii]CEO31507.1 Uncharacterised protein [[Clostridium] sordellii] [Paeniclostridium sordellii]CEP44906.1 Uncharacterised protein [[Clostridium] sordellii] [Paeniclostridium sordellii]CEP49416.1 Uncharacterised protein [[Clostridium] sordellii] [Paeniclostridium sordellii]
MKKKEVLQVKRKNRNLDNMIFISNDDLENKDLDLYEVLNITIF